MIKKLLFTLFCLISYNAISQIINQAPYILTIDELKSWTQSGPTADPILITTEELATRFVNTDTQLNPNLSDDLKIAYLPDGMNNFANYGTEQSQFNLYNFTNWAYIDKLVWFGGTADQSVQLPSAPWTNAAHKNGVKVLGNIFFAPNAFGGSTDTLLNFLEQDSNDNFIVIPILIDIMQYYNFDGWFVNQETNTNPSTAVLMNQFVGNLTTAIEALNKEVMWYDAMILNGNVGWQNTLNNNNNPFFQDDADGDASNGFERRVSSSMFINFFWSGDPNPNLSKSNAEILGRSEFDIFTGVDVWPGRNQSDFETGGNNWMSDIHQGQTNPTTSFGLFAANCVYNNSQYSNFNNDPSDYANFYSEERHMFAGADRNPSIEDNSGFRGYSNWVPSSSTITTLPFETNFNTGHGLKKFEEGIETSNSPWHNMNDQDILPSWQFAFSENNALSGSWNFNNAYNGGSSLEINGELAADSPIDLKLYKTKILLDENSRIDITYNYQLIQDSELKLLLTFPSFGSLITFERDISPNEDGDWVTRTIDLSEFAGQELSIVGLQFESLVAISSYALQIGNIKIFKESATLSLADNSKLEEGIIITYPNDSKKSINIITSLNDQQVLDFDVYSIHGRLISNHSFNPSRGNYKLDTSKLSSGIYLLNFRNKDDERIIKRIIIR